MAKVRERMSLENITNKQLLGFLMPREIIIHLLTIISVLLARRNEATSSGVQQRQRSVPADKQHRHKTCGCRRLCLESRGLNDDVSPLRYLVPRAFGGECGGEMSLATVTEQLGAF